MKTIHHAALGTILMLASCAGTSNENEATGVFETTEVTVSAQGTGEIMQLHITEGQTLQSGQAVGCIDTLQLSLRKDELLGNLQATRSRFRNVECQIASLEQQIATQKKERQRIENLLRDHAANQKQLDDINAQIALLEKQLAAQTENLEKGNQTTNGQVRMLEAQIAQVEDQIRRSVITIPSAGTVLSKYAEAGELATTGQALFKLGDLENMYLRAYVTAPQLTTLKIGQQVRVFADEGEENRREYAGTVTWISDQAEFTPKTIQTRDERANLVYAVKIAVRNDGYIKRGMYGEMETGSKE